MMEMMLESYTLDLSFTWLKNMEHLEKEVERKILFLPCGCSAESGEGGKE